MPSPSAFLPPVPVRASPRRTIPPTAQAPARRTPRAAKEPPPPPQSIESILARAEKALNQKGPSARLPMFRKHQRRHRKGPAAHRQSAEAAAAAAAAQKVARKQRHMLRDGVALRELALGAELSGVVRNMLRHGAYVDVGAVTDGLVHVRDMSVEFVHSPRDLLREGDNVTVWVKYVNPVTNVLGLTMVKPTLGFVDRVKIADVKIGARYEGFVERVTNYGAYVDIGAERLGFLHVAAIWGRRPRDTLDFLRIGQPIWVHVDDVDEIRSHIKLRARGRGHHELTKEGPLGDLAKPEDVVEKGAPVVKSEVLRQRVMARPGDDETLYNTKGDEEEEDDEDELDDDDLGDDLTQPGLLAVDEIKHMFDANTEFVDVDPSDFNA